MFAYGTEDCPPVDLVTGPGNVYVAAAKRLLRGRRRHRLRGRSDRDRHPRRRHRRPARSSPPTSSRRPSTTRNASCLLVTDRAPALLDAVDAELARQVAAHPAPRAGRDRAAPTSRRYVLVDDLDAGARRRRRVGRRAPRGHDPRRRAWARPRRATPAPIFVGPYAPVSLGDYLAGLQPRAAHRRHRAAHRRPVGAVVPARHARRRVHARRAGRRSRRTSTRSAAPRTCARTSTPCGCASRASRGGRRGGASDLPLRDDLRGPTPYGAPQLDVAGRG